MGSSIVRLVLPCVPLRFNMSMPSGWMNNFTNLSISSFVGVRLGGQETTWTYWLKKGYRVIVSCGTYSHAVDSLLSHKHDTQPKTKNAYNLLNIHPFTGASSLIFPKIFLMWSLFSPQHPTIFSQNFQPQHPAWTNRLFAQVIPKGRLTSIATSSVSWAMPVVTTSCYIFREPCINLHLFLPVGVWLLSFMCFMKVII